THVFETHVHNDYVTGGLALARVTGASYYLNEADEVAFDRAGISDGMAVGVGEAMQVEAIATPGHTFTHLSYALRDVTTGRLAALFTGGSLLYGATGRPCSAPSTGPGWPPRSTRRPGRWPGCPRPRRSGPPTGSAASARPARPP